MAEKKTKAGRLKPLFLIVLVFGPASLLIFISLNKCEHKFEELPVYGNIGAFSFETADGTIVSDETQSGHITLFTTIQTTCPRVCAIDIPKINLLLYQHYRKNKKKLGHVTMVSIATDEFGNPIDDLSEVVMMLEDIIPGYDPEVWKVVKGDPKQVYNIVSNDMNLYEQQSDSSFAGKPYLETLMIVDKTNHLRLIRRGGEEGLIRDFKQHVALLQKQYDKAAYKAKKSN